MIVDKALDRVLRPIETSSQVAGAVCVIVGVVGTLVLSFILGALRVLPPYIPPCGCGCLGIETIGVILLIINTGPDEA